MVPDRLSDVATSWDVIRPMRRGVTDWSVNQSDLSAEPRQYSNASEIAAGIL
jgi:hypothetical protein